MDVRAGKGAAVRGCPFLLIDGLGGFEIEREGRDNLPSEAEVRTSAKTIRGGDGEGVQDVVLVEIDAVVPLARVKALQPQTKR